MLIYKASGIDIQNLSMKTELKESLSGQSSRKVRLDLDIPYLMGAVMARYKELGFPARRGKHSKSANLKDYGI